MALFSRLPNEIFYAIASILYESEVNALAQANSFAYHLMNPILYQKSMHQSNGWPLLWGIIHRRPQTVKKALETKATALVEALALAASSGQDQAIKYLLYIDNARFEAQFVQQSSVPRGWSNKMWTSDRRTKARGFKTHETRVRDIDKGPSIFSDRDTINGRAPLSRAVLNGHIQTVELLLGSGHPFLAAKDSDGRTPLSHAAQRGYVDIARLLLDSRYHNISAVDCDSRRAMDYAILFGSGAMVDLLIKSGDTDMDTPDDTGRTPFSWAAQYGNLSTLKYLVESGRVNIEARDREGRTPFSHAAGCADAPTVQYLFGLASMSNPRAVMA